MSESQTAAPSTEATTPRAEPLPPVDVIAETEETTREPIVELAGPEPRLEEGSAVVPLPGTLRQDARPSFWKRISLRGRGAEARGDRVLARLDVLESRLGASEASIGARIQQLDERFSEVWEVEEQLSQMNELRETLEELSTRQLQHGDQLRGLGRKLSLLSVLVAAAAVAGVAAILL